MLKCAANGHTIVVALLILCVLPIAGCSWPSTASYVDTTIPQTSQLAAQDPNHVLLVTGEYAPYTTQNPNNQGFFSQIVEEVFRGADMSVDVEFFPWPRCQQMVADGQVYAMFPYSFVPDNSDAYLRSDPIMRTDFRLFYRTDNAKITDAIQEADDLSDLKGLVVAGSGGYWYGSKEDLESLGLTVEWANGRDAMFKMLQSGRVDFVIEDALVGHSTLARLFPMHYDEYDALTALKFDRNYYLMASRAYPDAQEMLAQFNQSLGKLRRSGRISEILDEYGIVADRAQPVKTHEP